MLKKTAKPKDKIDRTVTDAFHSFECNGFRWVTVDPKSQEIQMRDQVFAPKYTDNSLLIDLYNRKPSKQYQDSQKNPKERDVKYFNSHSNVRNHTIMFSHCYQKTCQRCVDYHNSRR